MLHPQPLWRFQKSLPHSSKQVLYLPWPWHSALLRGCEVEHSTTQHGLCSQGTDRPWGRELLHLEIGAISGVDKGSRSTQQRGRHPAGRVEWGKLSRGCATQGISRISQSAAVWVAGCGSRQKRQEGRQEGRHTGLLRNTKLCSAAADGLQWIVRLEKVESLA